MDINSIEAILNVSSIESSPDGHRVSQVSAYRCLRLNAVDDPVRIVIQRQLRTRTFLVHRGFGKGFGLRCRGCDNKAPDTRSGLCCVSVQPLRLEL